ncbi:MAG: rod shape-determining protein MreC [Candidatus Omnitrophica bacterium]|nr:rod shape-determining protein MreC [Candidatus Omnitrophota bacterium]MCM8802416.1 rod shape-determining protein MreC [Candidatus Omnitrophota bacterium]
MLWRFRRELIFILMLFTSYFIEKISFKRNFSNSNTKLVKENLINYEEIIQENKRLRELLELKEKKIISNFKVAEVIAIKPHIFPAEIFINKGRKDGISENNIVFTKDIFLVGRVEEVNESYSKVISIFNKKTKISVIISSTREIGIVEGGYAPFLLMKYIPYDSKVKIGDEVYTSGFSEYYYSGLKIGEVVKISKNSNSLFLNIFVKPYIYSYGFKEVIIAK